jgi:hypothetical protein
MLNMHQQKVISAMNRESYKNTQCDRLQSPQGLCWCGRLEQLFYQLSHKWTRKLLFCSMWCKRWKARSLARPPNSVTKCQNNEAQQQSTLACSDEICDAACIQQTNTAKCKNQALWMWCKVTCRQIDRGVPHNCTGLKRTTSLGKIEM